MTETMLIIGLAVAIGILGILLILSRVELSATREAWDRAVESAERADERALIVQHNFDEAMARPNQVLVPQDTVEVISHHVIAYLSATEKK